VAETHDFPEGRRATPTAMSQGFASGPYGSAVTEAAVSVPSELLSICESI